jgi:hypothetical protein
MDPRTRTTIPAQVLVTKVRYVNYGGIFCPVSYPPSPFLRLTCDEQSIVTPSLVAARDREQTYNICGTLSLWCA